MAASSTELVAEVPLLPSLLANYPSLAVPSLDLASLLPQPWTWPPSPVRKVILVQPLQSMPPVQASYPLSASMVTTGCSPITRVLCDMTKAVSPASTATLHPGFCHHDSLWASSLQTSIQQCPLARSASPSYLPGFAPPAQRHAPAQRGLPPPSLGRCPFQPRHPALCLHPPTQRLIRF